MAITDNIDFNFIEKNWPKKRGLIYSLIFLSFFSFIILPEIFKLSIGQKILINFIIDFLCLVIWLFSTNRIPNPFLGAFTVIYITAFSDLDDEDKVSSILRNIIKKLKSELIGLKLKLVYLETNNFKDDKDVEAWRDKNSNYVHTVIMLNFRSGELNSKKKYQIEKIGFTAFIPNFPTLLGDLEIHLVKELSLRNIDKNWDYIEQNSFDDKEKLFLNLRDIILYYFGIVKITELNAIDALMILKKLTKSNNINEVQKQRHNSILMQLYLKVSLDELSKNDIGKALTYLHEAEQKLAGTNLNKGVFMNLAYTYYKMGDLVKSIFYTEKMKAVGGVTLSYLVNMGFYSIIENDLKMLIYYYKQISSHQELDTFPSSVIGFLEGEKEFYPDKTLLITFCQGWLYKTFCSEEDGNNNLVEFINGAKDRSELNELVLLARTKLSRNISKKKIKWVNNVGQIKN